MTKLTTNFTNIKRIFHKTANPAVIINAENRKNGAKFNVSFNLEKYNLDPDAKIMVYAYKGTLIFIPFDYGTVKNIKEPKNTYIHTLTAESLNFRIKVSKNGRLIAKADKIKPQVEDKTQDSDTSLLPIQERNDISQLYKIEIDTADELGQQVKLVVSKDKQIKKFLINDKNIQSLVYPQVLNEILTTLLIQKRFRTAPIREEWIEWGEQLVPDSKLPHDADEEMIIHWINLVVDEFCSLWKFKASFEYGEDTEN